MNIISKRKDEEEGTDECRNNMKMNKMKVKDEDEE